MGINTSWVRFQSQEIENSRLIGANTVQASTTKSLFNIQYFIIYARVTTRFPLTGAVTPAQVYAILIGNLDAAMTSGNYVNYLQSYAVTLNTGTATFTDITQEDVRVTNEALILYGDPTATPTLSPTYVKPHRLPNPELIGTVLGVFFGSIMIAIILYFAILSVRANRRDEALITAPQSGTSNNSRATANNKTREEIYLPVEIDDDAPRGLGSVGKHMLRRDMALAAHNKAKTNVVQVVFENQQL